FMSLRGKEDFSFYYTGKAMYGWIDAGLDELRSELESREDTGAGERLVHRLLTAKGLPVGRFVQEWSVEEGRVEARIAFDLEPSLPELPRVGLRCRLTPGLNEARWFGLGPHEAYSDRKAGARLGLWSAGAEGLSVPYIVPQENGNRHQARWLELSARGAKAPSLAVSGSRPFDFSLAPYSDEELWAARHWDCLPPFGEALAKGAWLHLDAAQRGVGTATCGPDTLERYRLRPGVYRLALSFEAY
ncbi:MAG: glycoside hydrolase family 2, partial [Spirochaetaceae bacterium]|nr:glycoside hydrolase family 2 [Spirochaetaceae bacterium]